MVEDTDAIDSLSELVGYIEPRLSEHSIPEQIKVCAYLTGRALFHARDRERMRKIMDGAIDVVLKMLDEKDYEETGSDS